MTDPFLIAVALESTVPGWMPFSPKRSPSTGIGNRAQQLILPLGAGDPAASDLGVEPSSDR